VSKLRQRIDQLKEARERIIELDTNMVSRGSLLQLLKYHINLLKEVDKLVDAIESGDAAGVQEFYARRVGQDLQNDNLEV
jgi:hypothetical protein